MTPDLKKEQAEVFELLQSCGNCCFLRQDQSDNALWVTDYPRRNTQQQVMRELLKKHGIDCCVDEKNSLWHLDWSAPKWEETVNALPEHIPPLPAREKLHEAYALCRLWLLHPGKAEDLRPARRLLKLGTETEEKLLHGITAMHEAAASALRGEGHGAYTAGRIMAAWLIEKEM